MPAVREERAIEQRGLDDRDLQPTEEPAHAVGDGWIAEHVVEQQRDDVHRNTIRLIFDLSRDRGADVRNQVLRHRAHSVALGRRRQLLLQRSRQIEALPVTQCGEKRRRGSERHHRVEVGEVSCAAGLAVAN